MDIRVSPKSASFLLHWGTIATRTQPGFPRKQEPRASNRGTSWRRMVQNRFGGKSMSPTRKILPGFWHRPPVARLVEHQAVMREVWVRDPPAGPTLRVLMKRSIKCCRCKYISKWSVAEGSERYWTCGLPKRPERVCRSFLQPRRRWKDELYYTLKTQLLRVISKLTCCATTKMFSSSFWRTGKFSFKKFGCIPLHPEQRDTSQSTRSHRPRGRGSRC